MKLIEKWKVHSFLHVTTFYLFQRDDLKNSCISVCHHYNGEVTYLLSDEETPTKFYGSEDYIKSLIEELDNEANTKGFMA